MHNLKHFSEAIRYILISYCDTSSCVYANFAILDLKVNFLCSIEKIYIMRQFCSLIQNKNQFDIGMIFHFIQIDIKAFVFAKYIHGSRGISHLLGLKLFRGIESKKERKKLH